MADGLNLANVIMNIGRFKAGQESLAEEKKAREEKKRVDMQTATLSNLFASGKEPSAMDLSGYDPRAIAAAREADQARRINAANLRAADRAAQKQDIAKVTAELTNRLASGEKLSPEQLSAYDPRALYQAQLNALQYGMQKARYSDAFLQAKKAQYESDLEDFQRGVQTMDAAWKAGDTDTAGRLADFLYNKHVFDGLKITGRKGDIVTITSAVGQKQKLKDDLPLEKKLQMLNAIAQSPSQYFRMRATAEAARQQYNFEQAANPTMVIGDDGKPYYRIAAIDPEENLPTVMYFDKYPSIDSTPIKVEGAKGYVRHVAKAAKESGDPGMVSLYNRLVGEDSSGSGRTVPGRFYSVEEWKAMHPKDNAKDNASGVKPMTKREALRYLQGRFFKSGVMGQVENRVSNAEEKYRIAEMIFHDAISGAKGQAKITPFDAVLMAEQYIDTIEKQYADALAKYPEDKPAIDKQFKQTFGYLPQSTR